MAAALRRHVTGSSVVLIGTDVPGATRGHLRQAFGLLEAHDLVFGPARDGGYWLVGARRGTPAMVLERLFVDVRWSTEHALADTLANARRGLRVAFGATLRDVDTAEDLEAWRAQMRRYGPSGR